jgi:DNA-binding LacI/PurR family transcriptional regulator
LVIPASVVLNGRPTAIPVGAETRRRVLAAGAEMDYRPNSFARSLRTGRSRTLGLLVTTIADPFTGGVTQAMDLVARERGYRTLVMLTGMGLSMEGRPSTGTRPGQGFIDGALLVGFQLAIDVDARHGVHAALRHLRDLGHRRHAMIYDARHPAMRDRRASFDEFLRDTGLPTSPGAIGAAEPGYYEDGIVATARLLALPEPPTAILAANDQLAIGALQAAWRLGPRVPDDLSIVGFDDVPVAGYLAPPLTAVRQPLAELGRRATAALIDLLGGHAGTAQAADLVLQPELIIRASTAPPRGL